MKNTKLKLICFSTVISCLTLSATPIIAHADTITPATPKSITTSTNYQTLTQTISKTNFNQEKAVASTNLKNESSSFVKEMNPYVIVKDGQYAISSTIYENKNITSSDISELKAMLAKSNEVVKKSNVKDLNVSQGNPIAIKTQNQLYSNFMQINGYNGFRGYWWGCVISLNSENSTALINAAIGGDAGAIGALIGFCFGDLPGSIAGGVVCGIIGGAMSVYGDNSPEATDGCNIQINYFATPHVQSVWCE